MKKLVLLLLAIMMLALSACGEAYARFSQASYSHLSFDDALFAFMPRNENYIVSPFSLRMALALAANGAEGETLSEILMALGIDDLDAHNAAAAATIESALNNQLVGFSIANSIWLIEDMFPGGGIAFSRDFERIVSEFFCGAAETINASDGAERVNAWVYEQTRGRIEDVVDDSSIEDALALIVSAIYFRGDWYSQFNASKTDYAIFTDRGGEEHSLSFMRQTGSFSFYSGEDFSMLAKPYADTSIRMYFVLSNTDERPLFGDLVSAIDSMQTTEVNFRLPRFTTENRHDNLLAFLRSVGMDEAFDDSRADFTGMFTEVPGGHNTHISDVLQKTFIQVDEDGTEAAAVTVVEFSILAEFQAVRFTLNRPFIYFIRNDATGDILFIGEFAFAG